MSVLSLQPSHPTTHGQTDFPSAWISDFLRAWLQGGNKARKKLELKVLLLIQSHPHPLRAGQVLPWGSSTPGTEPCAREREQLSSQGGYQLLEDGLGHGQGGDCRMCEDGAVWAPGSQQPAHKSWLEGNQQPSSGSKAETQHPHLPPFRPLGLAGWSPS